MALFDFIFKDPLISGLILLNVIPVCLLVLINAFRPASSRKQPRTYVVTPQDSLMWEVLQKRKSEKTRPVIFMTNNVPARDHSGAAGEVGTTDVSKSVLQEVDVTGDQEPVEAGSFEQNAGLPTSEGDVVDEVLLPNQFTSLSSESCRVDEEKKYETSAFNPPALTAAGRKALAARLRLNKDAIMRTLTPDTPFDFPDSSPVTPSPRNWS